MALSLYSNKRHFDTRPITALMVINAIFASTVLTAWTVIAVFVAEPISWATWAPLSPGSQPDLFDYPFVLLWGLPLSGIFVSWVANKFYSRTIAYLGSLSPILVLSLVICYFYFVPVQYH